MNDLRTTARPRLALIAVAIISAVCLVVGCGNNAPDAVPETTFDVGARPIQVFVIDEFVPKGADAETIKAAVSLQVIPSRLEQPGGVIDLAELDGKVAALDFEPGDQLLAGRLVPAEWITDDAAGRGAGTP